MLTNNIFSPKEQRLFGIIQEVPIKMLAADSTQEVLRDSLEPTDHKH